MKQTILDLRMSLFTGTYFAVTFSDLDFIMKFIVFLITVGYTVRRWYLLEKNKKDEA